MHIACLLGHLEIVKYLAVECGCDPKYVCQDGSTLLHLACMMGQLEIIKYLVTQCKCDPMCVSNNGSTPLRYACTNGHLESVKYLVNECKCDPMHVAKGGNTSLHFACAMGNLEVVKHLVMDQKCIPSCTNESGVSPLFCACLRGHIDTVKYLVTECECYPSENAEFKPSEHFIESSSDVFQRSFSIHQMYPFSVNMDMFRNILSNTRIKGVTPLHAAIVGGHLNIMKYLITECDCNPNYSDNFGVTLLGYALMGKQYEILQYLITDCKCNSACSPEILYGFLQQQCGECDLLDLFKDFYKVIDLNITPLQMAIFRGDFETVKVLCDCKSCTESLVVTPLEADVTFEAACNTGFRSSIMYTCAASSRSPVSTRGQQ